MKSTIGAIALIGGVMATAAAIALAGSTAFAAGTNAVESAQNRIHAEWDRIRAQRDSGKDSAVTASRTIASQVTFTAPAEPRSGRLSGHWIDNYRIDRARDHAER